MKTFLISLTLTMLFISIIAYEGDSQWTNTFDDTGNDYCYSSIISSTGHYLFAGYNNTSGEYNALIAIKTDADGDTVWTKKWGTALNDYGMSICETSDGGYVIAGYVYQNYQTDLQIAKMNADGDSVWIKDFYGDD